MEHQDFWTTVILAVLLFCGATLPLLLRQGLNNYTALLIAGPLAMALLAWWGYRSALH